mgnify:CR=1 FL=1
MMLALSLLNCLLERSRMQPMATMRDWMCMPPLRPLLRRQIEPDHARLGGEIGVVYLHGAGQQRQGDRQ